MGLSKRVLLVEDAPFLRYAFSRLLRMQGYDVREANDGREALDCIGDYLPHLVLTDLMMPVMGGVELIGHIRADRRFDRVPIVAITADATEQAEQLARKAGAIDVITKPIDLPALLDRLKFLVEEEEREITEDQAKAAGQVPPGPPADGLFLAAPADGPEPEPAPDQEK